MNCERVQREVALFLYGELSFEREEEIERHLEECEVCRSERDRVCGILSLTEAQGLRADHQLLAENRRTLRIRLAQEASRLGQWQRLRFLPGLFIWQRAFAAAALVAAGYFAGLWQHHLTATDPIASRVRYVAPNDSGQIQIVVEETSHRTLSGRSDEKPIRRLLLAAARDSADPRLRVETVDILKDESESLEVRRALLYVLRNDPDSGVRLKALEGLRASATEKDTREALAQIVLTDDNPGVRSQAIELLVQKREAAIVGVLQGLMAREDDARVRLRCERALLQMKASAEVF